MLVYQSIRSQVFLLSALSFRVVEAAPVVATPDSLLTPMLQPSAAWAAKELELPEAIHLEQKYQLTQAASNLWTDMCELPGRRGRRRR